jgi:hypothetical protein
LPKKELVEEIKTEIDDIRIIDTHEHIPPQKIAMMADESYLFYIFSENAFNYNFEAAGMPREAWIMKDFDLKEAWKRLKPYIQNLKSSPYYRSFMNACRDLFNIDYTHIDSEKKWIDLSIKFAEANRRKDWYEFVLKKKSKIDLAIVVQRGIKGITEVERDLFKAAINFDDFIRGYDGGILTKLENLYGVNINSFDDYIDLLGNAFKKAIESGAVAIKSAQAYERSLNYELVHKQDARMAFPPARHLLLELQDIYPLPVPLPELVYPASIDPENIKYFQDYIMQMIIENASKYHIPVQIHTGLAPRWEHVEKVNPLHLTRIIRANRTAIFDLLHGGFPYSSELGQMARSWPNIFINIAWMPIGHVGFSATKRVLSQWLDNVPWFKITWGGDTGRVEELYGASLIIRQLISEVLAEKVEQGWHIKDAIEVGRRILRENALKLYNLKV